MHYYYYSKMMKGFVCMLFIVTGIIHGQSIIGPPANTTGITGETVTFHCQMKFDLHETMTWEFNGMTLYYFNNGIEDYPMKNPPKFFVSREGDTFSLTLIELDYRYGGTYTCTAFIHTKSAFLIVLGKPTLTPPVSTPVEHKTAAYTCKAQFGGPSDLEQDRYPQLRIFFDYAYSEGNLQECEPEQTQNAFHLCVIYNLIVDSNMHLKKLKCELRTTYPSKTSDIFTVMHVFYPVRDTIYSPDHKIFPIGSQLTCSAGGNPQPTFEWINEQNQDLSVNSRWLNITEDMVGRHTWRCIARNRVNGQDYEDSVTTSFDTISETSAKMDGHQFSNYIPLIILIGIIGIVVGILAFTCFKNASTILTKYQKFATRSLNLTTFVTLFGNSFPHGWNTGVLNSPQHLIKGFINTSFTERFEYELSSSHVELLWAASVSFYLLGGIGGVAIADWMAGKFGRKKALLFCHIPVFLSALLSGFCKVAHSFEMLIIARLMAGLGCGAGSALATRYLIEIAPKDIRDTVLVFHQLAVTCGILASQIFGLRQLLGRDSLWPILLILTCIPCLVSCALLPKCPESPRYLMEIKEEAAETALKELRGSDDVSADKEHLKSYTERWSVRKLLGAHQLRWLVILLSSLALCQQLSGINVIFYYSAGVYEYFGIPANLAQYAVLSTGIINVLLTGISIMAGIGRRKLLLGGMVIMLISAILITVALHLRNVYISIISMITFVIGFALELGSIQQVIGAEFFTQGPRSPAMFLAGILNWIANFFVAFFFPIILETLGPNSFIVFIIFLVAFGILFLTKLPETKGNSREQVYDKLGIGKEYAKNPEGPETVPLKEHEDENKDGKIPGRADKAEGSSLPDEQNVKSTKEGITPNSKTDDTA